MLVEARDQFKSGVPLFGRDGAFHRVLEDFLNAALEGEMDSHLQETKPLTRNRRNGKMHKQLQTEYGPVEIGTPRDRDGSFSPEIVQKRQGLYVSCIEEIAYRRGYISAEQLMEIAGPMLKTDYGQYLAQVAKEGLA